MVVWLFFAHKHTQNNKSEKNDARETMKWKEKNCCGFSHLVRFSRSIKRCCLEEYNGRTNKIIYFIQVKLAKCGRKRVEPERCREEEICFK